MVMKNPDTGAMLRGTEELHEPIENGPRTKT